MSKNGNKRFRIEGKDLLIMSVMTAIYLAIALYNLGSTKVPQTFWKPERIGESFIAHFDREYDLGKLDYYDGIGNLFFRIEYLSNETGEFQEALYLQIEGKHNLKWHNADLNVKTSALRFYVDMPGGTINEFILREKESNEPVKINSITYEYINEKSLGNVQNLFDEQKFDTVQNFMNSSYFDEIYFPRTAFENLNRLNPYETTHPPLGKLIIAVGIAIFGMNPFGWRIMGTLFGAAMIPVMYLFGRKIFIKRIYGFIAAFLMMFDFMHFAQTRIGTIDAYPAFFIILAYYFMYDSFINKSYIVGFKKSLIPLFLSGVFWGLASASKWTAVYAGGGLAVLYFTSRILEYLDYKKALKVKNSKDDPPAWTKDFIKKSIIYASLCCIVLFVVIPIIIYSSTYLPIITLPGPGHDLGEIWRYQVNMLRYHSELIDPHPYQSPAYSWPFVKQPLYEYKGINIPAGKISIMYVLGNPAVFWIGIFCIFIAAVLALYKNDKRAVPLLVAFAFQYVPWFFIKRCIFIYHFFTATPFMMLCTVFVLYYFREHFPKYMGKMYMSSNLEKSMQETSKVLTYSYLVIVALLFVLFYPAISGMVVDESYLNLVSWMKIGY